MATNTYYFRHGRKGIQNGAAQSSTRHPYSRKRLFVGVFLLSVVLFATIFLTWYFAAGPGKQGTEEASVAAGSSEPGSDEPAPSESGAGGSGCASAEASGSRSLSRGAVAGIVISSLVGAYILFIFYLYFKEKFIAMYIERLSLQELNEEIDRYEKIRSHGSGREARHAVEQIKRLDKHRIELDKKLTPIELMEQLNINDKERDANHMWGRERETRLNNKFNEYLNDPKHRKQMLDLDTQRRDEASNQPPRVFL